MQDRRDRSEYSRNYYALNKERIKAQQHKQWNEQHKEARSEANKEWRELNAEHIRANKGERIKCDDARSPDQQKLPCSSHHEQSKHAELHDHADIDTKCKAYYHAHKQEINARMLEKVQCECGASVGRSYMPKHVTTKKHMTGCPLTPIFSCRTPNKVWQIPP